MCSKPGRPTCRAKGLAPRTISESLAAVRWAARKARRWGLIDAMAVAELGEVRTTGSGNVRQGRWLTMDELLRLIRAQGCWRNCGPIAQCWRSWAGCGLRRMEVCRLTFSNLDEHDSEPVAFSNLVGKHDKLRSIAIPALCGPASTPGCAIPTGLRCGRDLAVDRPRTAWRSWHHRRCRPISPDVVYRVLKAATGSSEHLPDVAPHRPAAQRSQGHARRRRKPPRDT